MALVYRRLETKPVLLRLLTLHRQGAYLEFLDAVKRAGAIRTLESLARIEAGAAGWSPGGTGDDDPHLQDWCCHHHSA